MPRVWDPYPYPLFGYAPGEPGWIVNSKDMERELPMWLVACRVRWLDSVRRTVARFLYIIALDASTHALFTGGVVASDRRRTVASRRHLSHRLCPGNEAISVAHLAIIARSHRRRPAAYLALSICHLNRPIGNNNNHHHRFTAIIQVNLR